MIIFMQNIISILQCYVEEFKDFMIFFIMHITHTAFILNYYELTLLSCIIIKHMNSLAVMIKILKQNVTQLINYSLTIVCFERLIKHLNAEDTINDMKIKLLDNCFNE